MPEYVIWGGKYAESWFIAANAELFISCYAEADTHAVSLPAEVLKEKGDGQKGPVTWFKLYLTFYL